MAPASPTLTSPTGPLSPHTTHSSSHFDSNSLTFDPEQLLNKTMASPAHLSLGADWTDIIIKEEPVDDEPNQEDVVAMVLDYEKSISQELGFKKEQFVDYQDLRQECDNFLDINPVSFMDKSYLEIKDERQHGCDEESFQSHKGEAGSGVVVSITEEEWSQVFCGGAVEGARGLPSCETTKTDMGESLHQTFEGSCEECLGCSGDAMDRYGHPLEKCLGFLDRICCCLSARLWYLQCKHTGDSTALHDAIDLKTAIQTSDTRLWYLQCIANGNTTILH